VTDEHMVDWSGRQGATRLPALEAYVRYVLVWLCIALACALLAASFNWSGYHRLATHGVRTTGTVTAVLPEDHASARYRYEVGGQSLEGQFSPWPPNPPLEDLRVGEVVTVWYDPTSPGYSVLGDPGPILRNETETVLLGPLWLATWVVLVWFVRDRLHARRRRRGCA
jgi:hypothetical protein